MRCQNISISEEDQIKYIIYSSINDDELITNINDLFKKEMKLSKIDEGNELLSQKEEKTIAFTSTYIQKIKDNKNSTVINLEKCEIKLKTFYNISEESYLYILKIDVEQLGKNYPKIEYEVFNRSQDGNMKC